MDTFVNIGAESKLYATVAPVGHKTDNAGKREAASISLPCSERMKEIYADISYVLEAKKVYLDANLSLAKLSQMLHTNTTYLSRVANSCFGCNLKTLLNKYRIDYAKDLLRNEACDIRQLPARCGFLSRSAFYAAFARFEHTTPKDFQSKCLRRKLRGEEATTP